MSLNTMNSFIKKIPQVVLELPTSLKNWKLNLIIINSPLKVLEELCQLLVIHTFEEDNHTSD